MHSRQAGDVLLLGAKVDTQFKWRSAGFGNFHILLTFSSELRQRVLAVRWTKLVHEEPLPEFPWTKIKKDRDAKGELRKEAHSR